MQKSVVREPSTQSTGPHKPHYRGQEGPEYPQRRVDQQGGDGLGSRVALGYIVLRRLTPGPGNGLGSVIPASTAWSSIDMSAVRYP